MIRKSKTAEEDQNMLWAITALLATLWILGLATSATLGGFIHLLLVSAVGLAVVKIVRNRKTLEWCQLSPRHLGSTKIFLLESKFRR